MMKIGAGEITLSSFSNWRFPLCQILTFPTMQPNLWWWYVSIFACRDSCSIEIPAHKPVAEVSGDFSSHNCWFSAASLAAFIRSTYFQNHISLCEASATRKDFLYVIFQKEKTYSSGSPLLIRNKLICLNLHQFFSLSLTSWHFHSILICLNLPLQYYDIIIYTIMTWLPWQAHHYQFILLNLKEI